MLYGYLLESFYSYMNRFKNQSFVKEHRVGVHHSLFSRLSDFHINRRLIDIRG